MSVEVTAAPAPAESSAVSTSTPARHIPSLDGIRACSFLLVFAAHAGLGLRLHVLMRGDFGVTVFFFLSGFLITTLLRSELEKHGSINIGHFWLRRALRILPPLFLVVSAAALLTLVLYPPGSVRASTVAAELLFYGNYWGLLGRNVGEPPGIGVVWSLAVEEHFYLLFPLLYIAMQKWRMTAKSQALLLWGLCAVILVWRCVLVLTMHATSARIYVATDTRVDSILFGCALAVWNNPVLDRTTQSPKLWKYLLLPLSLAVLLVSLVCSNELFLRTWCYSLQGAALTLVFICAVRYHSALPFRFLNYRPVAFIGTLSYSLYLVHDVIMHAAGRLWPYGHASWHILIALATSFVAAWIIYQVVEKPCARLRRKLTHQ